jgi:hypothetical protein
LVLSASSTHDEKLTFSAAACFLAILRSRMSMESDGLVLVSPVGGRPGLRVIGFGFALIAEGKKYPKNTHVNKNRLLG